MNQGVQILLERMSSNPDEFVPDIFGAYPRKWRDMINDIEYRVRSKGLQPKADEMPVVPLPFLNDEEIDALWNKMQQLQGDLFTKKVMNTLLTDTRELSSSFLGNPLSASDLDALSNISISPIQNTGAVSGTISARTAIGKLRYP